MRERNIGQVNPEFGKGTGFFGQKRIIFEPIPGNQLQYKRVNGPYKLAMIAGTDNKLPFGNLPRLLLAWVCTEAVRTQSRVLILGDSVSGFMRKLDIYSTSGEKYTRLRNQMDRLFHASVQLIYEDEGSKASVSSFVADRTEFWWDPKHPDERSLWKSKIRLGEDFFNEIISHPVPLDMNILKALKRSSLGLDWYLWLTYRTFALRAPLRLSWRSLYRQFGANLARAGDKNTVNRFRTECLRELKKIKAAWPELNYATAKGVLILSPSKPAIPQVPGVPHQLEQPGHVLLRDRLVPQHAIFPVVAQLMGVQFSRLYGALDLAFDKRAQTRFEQIKCLADPFVIRYRHTLLLNLVRAHLLGVLACEERSLFSSGLLLFSRQSSDLGPALYQAVIGERLRRAFLALG